MSMDQHQHQQEIEMEKTAKKRQANNDCIMEVLCVLNNKYSEIEDYFNQEITIFCKKSLFKIVFYDFIIIIFIVTL